jgi:hypothetical protein
MAIRSSGSPLSAEILLAATLRYLAGGSYIDISDLYQLPMRPQPYFWKTIQAIDQVLDNIQLPKTSREWISLSEEWNEKMRKMIGKCYLPGTTLALDGLVIETRKPTEAEVNGNVLGNFNRKGYYGMVALSAVDVYGHFLYSELEYSGSTNDDKAILYSELYQRLMNNELPDHLHIVADDAFCATHPQIITPFSRKRLQRAARDRALYSKLRSYNYLLSYQRCTVERAFGMLLRKFLLLTRKQYCDRDHLKIIFRVCCKLHNKCITLGRITLFKYCLSEHQL